MTQNKIMELKNLKNHFGDKILDMPYPKPYPATIENPKKIKAIVLGCDPSNFSDKGKTKELETVFGIIGKGKDGRYFGGIKSNLKELNLCMDYIYVQNLCRNYFDKETAKNKIWMDAAKLWRVTLKKEIDKLFDSKVPVFATSEKIYHALINDDAPKYKPIEIYSNPEIIPFKNNFLERPLIPLYRHHAYSMKKNPEYKKRIIHILS
jgi:hypothetical protein